MAEAEEIARKYNVPLHTTSAFTGEGVEDLFMSLIANAMGNSSAAAEAAAAVAAVASSHGGDGGRSDGEGGGTIRLEGVGGGVNGGEGGGCC